MLTVELQKNFAYLYFMWKVLCIMVNWWRTNYRCFEEVCWSTIL